VLPYDVVSQHSGSCVVGLVVKVEVGTTLGDRVDEYVGDEGATEGVADGNDGLRLGVTVGRPELEGRKVGGGAIPNPEGMEHSGG